MPLHGISIIDNVGESNANRDRDYVEL